MNGFKWRPGPTYHWRAMTFYAMNGSICISDERPGLPPHEQFIVLSRTDFLERAIAFGGQAKALARLAAEHPGRGFGQERNETLTLVEDMLSCVRDAKEQGDPNDPKVREWVSRHSPRKRSRSGGGRNYALDLPGPLPRGRDTGKQATPTYEVAAAPAKAKSKLIMPGS